MLELSNEALWQESPQKAQDLGKEQTQLEQSVHSIIKIEKTLEDIKDWLEMLTLESDQAIYDECQEMLSQTEQKMARLEFRRMFNHPLDQNDTYLEIQSGSGGTEAQDWAQMLMRMYLRWGEAHQFQVDVIEVSPGEVAGIKSATLHFKGEYAYGWLRTENGVHRLVRKSPFDSGNRRHTSFAAVSVTAEVDDNIDIEIKSDEIRIDTYRSSGAGGQHVNKTDSAVRITHLPSNIVVQCQNNRSQHQNKDQAMKQLRAKLYDLEMQKRQSQKQQQEDAKADIGWGSQIRSYVLDQSRIKDLRTNVEVSSPQSVLDGDLDMFICAALKANA